MLKLIAACCAVAWAFAGFRNMPRLDHAQSSAAGFAIATSIMFAFWLGRRLARGQATATAVARAEARALAAVSSDNRSTASVFVNLDPNVGAARTAQSLGLGEAPWLAGAEVRSGELVAAETDFNESVMEEFAEETDR